MFERDPEMVASFVTLRWVMIVTFLGLGLLWTVVIGWVIWRLGPGGYSAQDAQEDRMALCAEMKKSFQHDDVWDCPPIRESQE